MATYTWTGYDALIARLGVIADPDPTSMLLEWEQIIEADNRKGVLAGLDKDDQPMIPVTYRPRGLSKRAVRAVKRATKRARAKNAQRGFFSGYGPASQGLHNNLPHAAYLRLLGPPLAPRGANSRVITNLFTEHRQTGQNMWEATGSWKEVVDTKGQPFLHGHFQGLYTGKNQSIKLPKRDLRGVRQWGRAEAMKAMNRWGKRLLSGQH